MNPTSNPHPDRRGAVLRAVREGGRPRTVADLAAVLGIHPNTVRFHLHGLERSGDVVPRRVSAPQGPGRPSITYQAAPAQASSHQRADLLAHILLAQIAEEDTPAARAGEAGQSWGRAEARRRGSDASNALDGLIEALDEAGFAPVRTDATSLDLLHCPLKEFVGAHGRIACAVHEGMMRGFLDASGTDVGVEALEPFFASGTCRTHLTHH